MNSSWESTELLKHQHVVANTSDDLLHSLRGGGDGDHLDRIASLALKPAYTSLVFAYYEDVFVEICSRWVLISRSSGNPFLVLAALARILPLAPHLTVFVRTILYDQASDISQAFSLSRVTGLRTDSSRTIHDDLLTIFRLLSLDLEEYASLVAPAQIQLVLGQPEKTTRYLAIRVLCMYLHASDMAIEKMIHEYVGVDNRLEGDWEDKMIDYTFLNLWESRRLEDMSQMLEGNRASRLAEIEYPKAIDLIKVRDLSSTTARVGRVLVPRFKAVTSKSSPIVPVETSTRNLDLLARAYIKSSNILVTGPPGAGKTSLVRDLARELGENSSMVTLHLNEQTDAKLLVGVYTSDNLQGSFRWHPGVLTKAVTEGRWVIIEDLDRAPPDIMSTLLPLLERRELLIPNRGEYIRAAPGFRLIATIRSFLNGKLELVTPGANMIGSRHWTTVPMLVPPDHELAEVVAHQYPILASYRGKIIDVYSCLRDLDYDKARARLEISGLTRPYGPRDLFRWCRRLEGLLIAAGVQSGHELISETTNDYILLEAVDCFAGFLPSSLAKNAVVGFIAKELQFPAERVQFCLQTRRPEYTRTDLQIRFGRASLPRRRLHQDMRTSSHLIGTAPFALNDYTLRCLESAGVAVSMAEPCLLVGETGTGKTAIIQHLAELVDTKLTVVNLSQQSEIGDLLGGYKPVNMRTLAIPLLEEFEDLFKITFSSKRNQRYIDTVTKAVAKGHWRRALTIWQEALHNVETSSIFGDMKNIETAPGHPPKKRRVDRTKHQILKTKWELFGSKLQTFRMHLASGSKGFAFSFVEGNIVKAARYGYWVLLDEINLASSDTLESIAELLSSRRSEGPSLLLSETGNVEPIRAHKDFRIFGAMNPATDVGKRELPASFRARFTEIFIEPPDKSFENLVSIIKVYLKSHVFVDVRIPSDIANVYLEVKELAEQNVLVDGSQQKPHYSLRTLTRTLVYAVDISPIYGIRRALYEGFCMSFLTSLSSESANLVAQIIEKYLLGPQKNRRALLNQIPRPPESKAAYVRFKQYWIAQGSSPIEEQPNFIITPFVERNLLNLVRATMTRKFPVLLQGPTSSGKTSMIEYLAKISGNKFIRINNHEHTDLQEYLGTYVSDANGTLQYKEGVLVRALREGSWVVLDELNLAPTDVLEALNRLLDDSKELLIPETQQVVRPHEDFMLFATQNPPGIYGGRKVLSRAFRNRFIELHFDDIPEEELETILRQRCQIAPSFCTRIVAVYKRLTVLRQTGRLFEQRNSFATLRDLFRWALRDAVDREQLAVNGFLLLAERVRDPDERKAVKEIIEDVMKVRINESLIYNREKLSQQASLTKLPNSNVVWTRSMCRLYVLVTEAFKTNEPVLLVGETGSGKTTICQVCAQHTHTHVHIVNAHQNMETGDLIGSQRPVRNKDAVNSQLAEELAQVLKVSADRGEDVRANISAMLKDYDALSATEKANISEERRLRVESSRTRSNALFQWMDGSLVHAMKTGEHFLLDEISLADDSVLERLNSVLEPGRSLFLAEKGTDDAPIVASSGFQFCATMNPGGDYGKKELSPALRNRFTEIWVPNTDEKQEILEIARAKLAARWTTFAEPMVAFGAWFSSHYNTITPSTSIRDLLAWILFLNRSVSDNDCSVILHGAATVYVDSLGADPAAKLTIPASEVASERHACLLQLSLTFKHDMVSIYYREYALLVGNKYLTVGPFKLNLNHSNWRDPQYSLDAPTTKANVLRIVRALQLPKPILLEGSPGVGKTTLIAEIAGTIGMPLTRINLSDQTDLMDLFGSDVPLDGAEAGRFGWREAPFLRAMQNGEWVLLDEMNLASQSVLEGLNACLDHRGEVYVPELDQTFTRHPDFVLFAAQNPHRQGGGRKGLPSSFVNRFTVVYINEFTLQDQLTICRRAFPTCSDEVLENVTQCITAMSAMFQNNPAIGISGGPWEFNLRDAFRWLHLITSHDALLPAGSASYYADMLFLQRLRDPKDVISADRPLRAIMPRADRAHSLFNLLGTSFLQVGLGLLTKSNSRSCSAPYEISGKISSLALLESIILCIENRWPCLLVGDSGSGKTDAIMLLANAVGAEVVTIHLNADMDTMDLIGGYEQADPQRKIAYAMKRVRQCVRETIIEGLLLTASSSSCLDALENQLQKKSVGLPDLTAILRDCAEKVPMPEFLGIANELDCIMMQASEDSRGNFEWIDGILIKALQEGSWLILDNANLCSPSVLDRLNSLLEPNGLLSINERRSSDGSALVIKPHPSFRLFMTSDPRHGELSRAMRNRSVELHLPVAASPAAASEPCWTIKSGLARYQIFGRLNWVSLTEPFVVELATICLDHLSFPDFSLRHQWVEQVDKGLLPLQLHQLPLFSYVVELYDRMMSSQSTLFPSIQARYEHIAMSLNLDSEWLRYSQAQVRLYV
jgi:midasin